MELKVLIYRRPNFRSAEWEMLMEVGRNALEDMFDHKKVNKAVTELTFIFPERYLNILEQRLLIDDAIPKCFPNVKKVTIYTHSVYIIQCTPNGCAFLVEENVPLKNHKWGDPICTPFKSEVGLQVFGVGKDAEL